jgi:hypothetical protein
MHGSKRATSLVVWFLVSQIMVPAHPVRAMSSDSSTLPTGRSIAPAGGAAGGAAPATELFTGAAAHTIPLELPLGTGGMMPQLALQIRVRRAAIRGLAAVGRSACPRSHAR